MKLDDLISRAAVVAKVEKARKAARTLTGMDFIMVVKDMPAVDAVPVVHAAWKQTDAYPHWLYCLNCYKRIVPNVEWIEEYNIPTNYCPNCGAKMDGERRDEDAPDY